MGWHQSRNQYQMDKSRDATQHDFKDSRHADVKHFAGISHCNRSSKKICRNKTHKITPHRNGSTGVSAFLLNCFVRSPSWQHWLSLPLSLLFLLALGANTILLITIQLEASLHQPMYYLRSLLSLLDMVLCLTVIPKVLSISAWLQYCGRNVIENCSCTNMSVSRLSCDDVTINHLLQFAGGWTLLGSNLILIFLSYSLILRAVLRLKADGAMAKALSTCGSHFILILFFSTILLVFVLTLVAKKKVSPDVPVLLNVLHHVIPAALNPIVYGVRTQVIKQGIQRLLNKGW
ncbi:olfactory receptor 56A3-like [Neomonachus schauinslandi]|uniref:Olfactory receptor 56A3-like n=1 Tax=Neomonachus schauinslandi TaxID=29088 RepID=A0A2Y9GQ22_NEOSC|nr:olfactory receptor 56A3-like [Neomonachus schauinslandi]